MVRYKYLINQPQVECDRLLLVIRVFKHNCVWPFDESLGSWHFGLDYGQFFVEKRYDQAASIVDSETLLIPLRFVLIYYFRVYIGI